MKQQFNVKEVAAVIASLPINVRATAIKEFAKIGAEESELIAEVNKQVTKAFKTKREADYLRDYV